MLTKGLVKKTMDKLPLSFTLDELIDELIFVEKVEKGIAQSENNQTNSKQEAKAKLKFNKTYPQ
ncbi:MAG: hypothetical protein RL708_1869 [Bacteroidota bacterium]|jgi:hypothetical protein